MKRYIYDAAVLIAADRNEPRIWSRHKARLESGADALVPAPVVAQVSRSPRQASLRRLLSGCTVLPFDERDAQEAGRLLGRAETSDVVDAAVVTAALRYDGIIVTGDPNDINRLIRASGGQAAVVII